MSMSPWKPCAAAPAIACRSRGTTTASWPPSANRPSPCAAARANWRDPPTSSRSSSREMPGRSIGFVLGDVSGKGVPAALLMANLQACFRSQPPHALLRPAEVLATVNRHFFDSTAAERFATLVFAIYDDATGQVRYVNCAHCPPLLLRATGDLEILDSTATMLGAFEHWSCTEAATTLNPGDTLLLYSDGVTEAGADSGEEYGEDRLIHT